MTKDYDNRLRQVFGDECWDGFSEKEKGIALGVVEWYEGMEVPESERMENNVAGAIWAAARDELGEVVARELSGRNRRAVLTDVRYVMFMLVRRRLPDVPKSKIGDVLGIKRNHASILNALNRGEDYLRFDYDFRALYERMDRRVAGYLDFAERQQEKREDGEKGD